MDYIGVALYAVTDWALHGQVSHRLSASALGIYPPHCMLPCHYLLNAALHTFSYIRHNCRLALCRPCSHSIQACEREYRLKLSQGQLTDNAKFTYAWHLIKSQYKKDISKGIHFMGGEATGDIIMCTLAPSRFLTLH